MNNARQSTLSHVTLRYVVYVQHMYTVVGLDSGGLNFAMANQQGRMNGLSYFDFYYRKPAN